MAHSINCHKVMLANISYGMHTAQVLFFPWSEMCQHTSHRSMHGRRAVERPRRLRSHM